MPTQADMKAAMTKYVERLNADDLAGILALYADHATIEDPVGAQVMSGREALVGFYTFACQNGVRIKIQAGPHGTDANAAAMAAEVSVNIPNKGPTLIRLIEVMTFDEQCRITSMRAYWGPDDMTAA